MLSDLQALTLNVFFILGILFLHQFAILDNPRVKNKYSIGWYMATTALTAVLCMSFPFSMGSGFIFDLRAIPFILGSLYGGAKIYLFVMTVITLYRAYLGGAGFYTQLVVGVVLFPLFFYLIPRFIHFHKKQKITWVTLLVLLYSLLSCSGLFWTTGSFSLDYLQFTVMYMTVVVVTMWMATYFIENMRHNYVLREATFKLKKLQVVSELAASVSHEVRNPLTSVRGFIQMLREDPNLPVEKRTEYLDISYEELLRAQSIISDYLDFAKPNLDRLEPLNLYHEIQYVLKVATSLTNMQQIQVQSYLQDHCWVLGDSQKLRQCLINLMKNAIEAMEDGGTLSLHLSLQDQEVCIAIVDTGKGMTPQQLNRLGQPYYSTKEKGTGLGTMVVFSIIKGMGGRIQVESTVGVGTNLQIYLPRLEGY